MLSETKMTPCNTLVCGYFKFFLTFGSFFFLFRKVFRNFLFFSPQNVLRKQIENSQADRKYISTKSHTTSPSNIVPRSKRLAIHKNFLSLSLIALIQIHNVNQILLFKLHMHTQFLYIFSVCANEFPIMQMKPKQQRKSKTHTQKREKR